MVSEPLPMELRDCLLAFVARARRPSGVRADRATREEAWEGSRRNAKSHDPANEETNKGGGLIRREPNDAFNNESRRERIWSNQEDKTSLLGRQVWWIGWNACPPCPPLSVWQCEKQAGEKTGAWEGVPDSNSGGLAGVTSSSVSWVGGRSVSEVSYPRLCQRGLGGIGGWYPSISSWRFFGGDNGGSPRGE